MLSVVGLGYVGPGHVTAEARDRIRSADKLLYLGGGAADRYWLKKQNSSAESLHNAYAPHKLRLESYEEMIARMLAPLRRGRRVCAAFYGHPGVFVYPSHEAIRRARAEGFAAEMLPAISAEDCLYADLEVDPALHGCASFEATDFIVRPRIFDTMSALILWQIGAIGTVTYEKDRLWSRAGLVVLTDVLLEHYPADHEVIVYEAVTLPIFDPSIVRTPLARLAEAPVTVASTLYVPPLGCAPVDAVASSWLKPAAGSIA